MDAVAGITANKLATANAERIELRIEVLLLVSKFTHSLVTVIFPVRFPTVFLSWVRTGSSAARAQMYVARCGSLGRYNVLIGTEEWDVVSKSGNMPTPRAKQSVIRHLRQIYWQRKWPLSFSIPRQ
jgi:hypothetical protein